MADDKKGGVVFLDDFHAIDKSVLICNNENYGTYPINPASALEVCPLCKSLLPSSVFHGAQKRKAISEAPTNQHLIKKESIFCPRKGEDVQVGMGSACEICPYCGAYL